MPNKVAVSIITPLQPWKDVGLSDSSHASTTPPRASHAWCRMLGSAIHLGVKNVGCELNRCRAHAPALIPSPSACRECYLQRPRSTRCGKKNWAACPDESDHNSLNRFIPAQAACQQKASPTNCRDGATPTAWGGRNIHERNPSAWPLLALMRTLHPCPPLSARCRRDWVICAKQKRSPQPKPTFICTGKKPVQ